MHFLFFISLSCALCFSAFSLPIDEDASSTNQLSSYEERIKWLTGGRTEPVCDQNKVNLNECLKQTFQEMMPRVAGGIPELNIQPYEPLKLNRTTFQINFGTISGRFTMKSGTISGMSSGIIKDVDFKADDKGIKMTLHSQTPVMRVLGNYKADITINNRLHFKPKGTFNLTLYDVDIVMSTEGKFFDKDGHKFVRLHKLDATPKIGNLDVDVTGIFEDPELSELVSTLAKQYWREVYNAFLPETRNYWAPLTMDLLNESLSVIPFDAFVKV